jgi:hypothetical protein
MIIDNMPIELMEFDNLYELLKVEQSPYILKYAMNKDEAIYYMISDGPNFILLGYCFDKNFENENITQNNGQIQSSAIPTAVTIRTVNIKNDTFLTKVFEAIYPEECECEECKPKKEKKTKKCA